MSCPAGVAWFQVPGYNGGKPFQAYTDTSVDGQRLLVFLHEHYVGEVKIEHPTSNQNGHGSPGFGSFRLPNAGTLLAQMCPSNGRFYVGQHDTDGSSLTSASNAQWIAWTDKSGPEFVDMFDSTPSAGQFTGSGMRRSDGTTNGAYMYDSGHGTTGGVHQCAGDSGSTNTNIIFEYSANFGTDPNHGFTVWGNSLGQYYNANRPGSTSRYGWMGVSGCDSPARSCGETVDDALPGLMNMASYCSNTVAWFQVPGYNGGKPFQAYTDTSVDGQRLLVFLHEHYVGEVKIEHPTSNQNGHGSPGFGSFRLPNAGTLLAQMCPSNGRFYVGQHDTDGSSLTSASNAQWIAWTDKSGPEFVDMFDSTPSAGQFTGSGMRRSDGTTNGAYMYDSGHGTTGGVHQCAGDSGSTNTNIIFEYSANFGTDPNHGFTVWGNSLGQYYNANRPGSTSRYGWMGLMC